MARPETSVSTGYALKRLLLGRPLATSRLEHERLGRPTALAIFSSDNMSSVAYATEEILRVLIPAVGVAAFSLVLPISGVIVLIEAILIFSYRQTIKAYPSAGGAYIVTKDNLGLLPAQLAGVALLVDYVLTVSVSTAAGVQAISSVVPLSVPLRILLSLVFIWMIAYGNLLGVRESGRLFAVPTYIFIFSLGLTCGVGLYQVLAGHVQPFSLAAQEQHGGLSLGTSAVAAFIVLRAFASGGAAVTGVEAISNGVPAFRKPEWRNAQITLGYMGAILGSSFLVVSFLASRLHVIPVANESKSVLAQIAQAVYGSSTLGHFLFLLLQISTTLILILAANTSFADFPRLASFHAGDAFMPRQLIKRGHKLVFSNGIIALAAAASVVIVVFRASVTNMIPLYALGVFTSFTLSQTGMARRHLRIKERGWKVGLFVNGLGAVSTFVVAVIIAIVKFEKGAWVVMVGVPILVYVLVRVNRIYEAEEEELVGGLEAEEPDGRRRHVPIVVVDQLDNKTLHALRYALTIRPSAVEAVHFVEEENTPDNAFRNAWNRERGLIRIPLHVVRCEGRTRGECLAEFVSTHASRDDQVTVIVPAPRQLNVVQRLLHGRTWSHLVEPLTALPNTTLVAVRDHGPVPGSSSHEEVRISPRARHVVIVLAGRLDHSVIKAAHFARSIDAFEVRALHAAADPDQAQHLIEQWQEHGHLVGIPLDVQECFDRNIVRSVHQYIDSFKAPDTEITVIFPRREYPHLAHRLLHDRTSRSISRGLTNDAHVEVIAIPYYIQPAGSAQSLAAGEGRENSQV